MIKYVNASKERLHISVIAGLPPTLPMKTDVFGQSLWGADIPKKWWKWLSRGHKSQHLFLLPFAVCRAVTGLLCLCRLLMDFPLHNPSSAVHLNAKIVSLKSSNNETQDSAKNVQGKKVVTYFSLTCASALRAFFVFFTPINHKMAE